MSLLRHSASIHKGLYGATSSPFPTVLLDGNTVAWYDYKENITEVTGVSVWGDKSGNGNDLKQVVTAKQPILNANGILFDGIDNTLKTDAFTLNQPEQIYVLFKQVSWSSNDAILDGITDNKGKVLQSASSPDLKAYAGGVSAANGNLPLGNYGVMRLLFNGASSKLQINETTVTSFDCGSFNMGGFTLGAIGDGDANFSNIEVKEVIIRKIADSTQDETDIYEYLKKKMNNTVILFFGESNSGGAANNSSALASELDENNNIKIWDNINNDGFENLKISDPNSNNMLGHKSLETGIGVRHGWELQLSNRADSLSFEKNPVYLIKAGQGGSKIEHWINGGIYIDVDCYATLKTRLSTALSKIPNPKKIHVFFSLGINDAIAGTNPETFKTNLLTLLSNFHNDYGNEIHIYATKLQTDIQGKIDINTKLEEIALSDSYFTLIDTSAYTLKDVNHWDYVGMKNIADDMIDLLLNE